jgi:3-hydroxyisobutyrate dehydrogenase-like beta-hydroxyacid dehydrogenase
MASGKYNDATMKVKVWQKDMQVIGDFAKAIGARTPLFSATQPIYDAALRSGYAMQDTASVYTVMEKMAGAKQSARRRKRR